MKATVLFLRFKVNINYCGSWMFK